MRLGPRASGEYIAQFAKDVSINKENVSVLAVKICEVLSKKKYSIRTWKNHILHPNRMDDTAVDWIFVADTLNFSFWGVGDKKFGVRYNGKLYTGYWSLHAAIQRALKDGLNIINPKYYASLESSEFMCFLKSDTASPIPLLDERFKILKESGKILNEKFEGSFVNCVKNCGKSAVKLLDLIVENFPSYKDEGIYEGQKVSFYKRAQILVCDIWACFEGKGIGAFDDIDSLTMFADYRIPQVLAYLGVLQYSDSLNEKLQKEHLFSNGDREEMELRGCTIAAVELLKEEIKKIIAACNETSDITVNSALIDFYLWDYQQSQRQNVQKIPFHKVRCIYY